MGNKLDADGMPKRPPHVCPDCEIAPTPELNFETPLRIEYDNACEMYSVRDYSGSIIARIRANDPELPAFIVRAVNTHLELLNYVRQYRDSMAHGWNIEAQHKINTIIAKAEGK